MLELHDIIIQSVYLTKQEAAAIFSLNSPQRRGPRGRVDVTDRYIHRLFYQRERDLNRALHAGLLESCLQICLATIYFSLVS
jgi:hypothetical protein